MNPGILRFFYNSMARQTFLLLFIGFILIQAAGVAIYGLYHHYALLIPTRVELANRLAQLVTITHMVPEAEIPHIVRAVNSPEIQLSLDAQPAVDSQRVYSDWAHNVRKIINEEPSDQVNLAVRLPDKSWLNIQGEFTSEHRVLIMSISSALLAMAIASFFLCAWAVRRFSTPLAHFSDAVNRLSIDINAPPLLEQGAKEIRQAIHAFNKMQTQIKRLVNNRTQMLAAISHDLRTPITRLKLRAEMFEGSQQHEKILRDLEEMESMISATLAFARDDYHEEPLEHFDLEALLDSICSDFIDAGYPVTYSSVEQHLLLVGRPNALKRVITNLIENAIKYGSCAKIALQKKKDQFLIEICDEGPGIPEKEMEKVFEPFYRIERSRSRETGGIGLGLAVAREIVNNHGGDIQLFNLQENGIVQGLKVIVSLSIRTPNKSQ